MLKEHQRLIVEGTVKFPSRAGEPPRLLGNKCHSCGKVFFPKRAICPNCFTNDTLTDYELSTQGTIYSYTIVRYPSPLPMEVPYGYGYVDLIKDNIRVFTLFTGIEPDKLKIGMEVELTVAKFFVDKDGSELVGYKFKPVRTS